MAKIQEPENRKYRIVGYGERDAMRFHRKAGLTTAVAAAVMMATGCRVDSRKQGDNENVRVATPFGGVQVKTGDTSVEEGIGLPVYPGAELVKKKGDDNGAADVNLSFGKFQLRVKGVGYRTPDSPDKVRDFYRNALKRYGTVIECDNGQPVGTPIQTDEGLTCEEGKKVNPNTGTSGKMELKAGSKQHQHIVSIDPEGSGTKFGVTALDLPGNVSVGEDDNRQ